MAVSENTINTYQNKYYAFTNKCDEISNTDSWNEDENGEMLTYFYNEITSIVIKLSSADGNITDDELGVLKEIFNIEYSKEEFKEVYASVQNEIDTLFKDTVSHSYELLSQISPELADEYLELVDEVCSIITECDDELSNSEKELANYIKEEIQKYK